MLHHGELVVDITLTVPETVSPLAGDVRLTVGGVVSEGEPFETVSVTVADVVVLTRSSAPTL